MSTLTHTRRLPESTTHMAAADGPAPFETEAPEQAAQPREAPEGRSAEAPDAGEGRAFYMEHEFTHGRSQS